MSDREPAAQFELDRITDPDEAGSEDKIAETKHGRKKSLLGGVAMGTAWATVGEVLMNDSKFTLSSGVVLGVVAYNQLRKNSFGSITRSIRNRQQDR